MIATLPPIAALHPSHSARTAALFAQPLPPSERDLHVYEIVVIEGASTRAAAQSFELSQTRIVQIRDRVAEWIADEVPPVRRLTARQRLTVAADIAQRRIKFLYSQAMDAWRHSQGEQTSVRTSGLGDESRITRTSCGDVRYLSAAMRIAEHKLRVAERALAKVEGSPDAEHNREAYASRSPEAEAPPAGDCSRGSVSLSGAGD